MTGDFSRRAARVQEMLCAETTAFLLVTSAQHEPIEEAIWFHRTLVESAFPFAGVVVNRVHHDLLGDREPEELVPELVPMLRSELAERVSDNFRDYHALACRDEHNVDRLVRELPGRPLLVPHFDDDVHDVEGLLRVHRYLFASRSERDRLIADVVA
jgi:anion-transporting  ArsA/GET3 family ATPase